MNATENPKEAQPAPQLPKRGRRIYRPVKFEVGELRYHVHRDGAVYEQRMIQSVDPKGRPVGAKRWGPVRRVTDPEMITTVLTMAADVHKKPVAHG